MATSSRWAAFQSGSCVWPASNLRERRDGRVVGRVFLERRPRPRGQSVLRASGVGAAGPVPVHADVAPGERFVEEAVDVGIVAEESLALAAVGELRFAASSRGRRGPPRRLLDGDVPEVQIRTQPAGVACPGASASSGSRRSRRGSANEVGEPALAARTARMSGTGGTGIERQRGEEGVEIAGFRVERRIDSRGQCRGCGARAGAVVPRRRRTPCEFAAADAPPPTPAIRASPAARCCCHRPRPPASRSFSPEPRFVRG